MKHALTLIREQASLRALHRSGKNSMKGKNVSAGNARIVQSCTPVARAFLLACGLIFSTAPSAEPPDKTVIVLLSNFKFQPASVQLRANEPAILELQNESSGGHSFVAPAFFAAAHVDGSSASLISNGRVEVPAHQAIRLRLVPSAGDYSLKCGHSLHAMFGMTGRIIVR